MAERLIDSYGRPEASDLRAWSFSGSARCGGRRYVSLQCLSSRLAGRGLERIVRRDRNRECERDAGAIVRDGPEPSAMILDDRSTDREADTHAILLGGVEAVSYTHLRAHETPEH